MKSALEFDARVGDPRRASFAPLGDRYSFVGKLRSTGRADLSIGLPAGARSIDELVVIKAYRCTEKLAEAPPEVEVASTPHHDNLARILECRWDADGYVVASEYLEGTTLRRLLRWAAAQGQKLPDAAVARLLLGMFSAVEHANQWTRAPRVRALVHEPLDATDVFVTCAGDVKVLGFKPRRDAAPADGATPIEAAAVDDLLSNQLSPALGAVLTRIGNRLSATSMIGLWQVAQTLKEWQRQELRSDGREALAEVMAGVHPEGRAARRSQLEVALNRVVRARDEAEAAGDATPVSGYRIAAASASLAHVAPAATPRAPELPPTVLLAGTVPLPAAVLPAAVLPAAVLPAAVLPTTVSLLPAPERAPIRHPLEPAVATLTLAPPLAPRGRSIPWTSLVMLAALLAAGLVVYRRTAVRRYPPSAAVAPAAVAANRLPPAAAAATTLRLANPSAAIPGGNVSRVVAREATGSSAPAVQPSARPKPAGAPARFPSAPAARAVTSGAPEVVDFSLRPAR